MRGTDWLLLWTLSLLWGGSFLFVELALEALTPLTIVWARVALAALILGLALRLTGQGMPPRGLWPGLLVMGLLNNAIPFVLIVVAQTAITGALASVLNATTPIFTVIVAHLATRDERLSPAKLAGVGLGFAGVVVMMAAGRLEGAVPAMAACLAAALSYGFASVWGRRFRQAGLAPMATAFGQVVASTVLLAPIWLWVDRPWAMQAPGAVPVMAVLALAVLSTALAYLIYFRILARAGATAISLVTFLVPLSAAGLGWLVLGERLEPRHLLGLALILGGLALIDRARAARPA
ncbi:DMT family transporter [Tabrizicola piscis]|uniref:DMT family transporter n=1 Tax=Tabrizicola piscis TaxID=2494374 RepID=A0A3S8U9P1_9RHOB|nr:DMT family transporter [Tabrizicola piscis]AZL60316.1 DMT family transporter [Tabrizicola piscis]